MLVEDNLKTNSYIKIEENNDENTEIEIFVVPDGENPLPYLVPIEPDQNIPSESDINDELTGFRENPILCGYCHYSDDFLRSENFSSSYDDLSQISIFNIQNSIIEQKLSISEEYYSVGNFLTSLNTIKNPFETVDYLPSGNIDSNNLNMDSSEIY